MSQTYGPHHPEQEPGHLAGPGFAGGGPGDFNWAGYASAPPPPPRRNHKRGLIVTGAVALAAGAAAGGLIGSSHGLTATTATAVSKTVLSSSAIAKTVDPALVDVVATEGDQGAVAAGTGIVLTSDGTVLTNNHVIRGATSIKVTDVGNGRTYTAKVVGYDATKDVAVIQLQNASGLTTASLGDSSSVQTGDSVTALGNAGGKGGTPSVATGTVTALNQSITASDEGSGVNSEQLTGLIETNADIQPGDSGGALVNSYGQVVGMNTAASSGAQVQSDSNQAAVQAFAIPIDNAETIAKQIDAGEGSSTVHIGATAFLGIESDGSSSGSGSGSGSGNSGGFGDGSGFGGFGDGSGFGQGDGSGLGQGDGSGLGGFGQGDGSGINGGGTSGGTSNSGVTISGTLSGSPAASAGLAEGDTITSVGGQSVSSTTDIEQILVKDHPGDKISISWVDQSGQSQTATVTLANGPAA
jgi:S1-C subfamily serine protease